MVIGGTRSAITELIIMIVLESYRKGWETRFYFLLSLWIEFRVPVEYLNVW